MLNNFFQLSAAAHPPPSAVPPPPRPRRGAASSAPAPRTRWPKRPHPTSRGWSASPAAPARLILPTEDHSAILQVPMLLNLIPAK